jgi:RNA polymerase sigma-70 factor (ECF subfamily)
MTGRRPRLIRWRPGGDVREFDQVALVHLDSLYQVALRWTRNRAEAEDLVQETYLRAFRGFHRFNPGTNCRAWLFTIMRNELLRRLRGHGREVLDEHAEDLVDTDAVDVGVVRRSPEEEFLQSVLHGDVDRALNTLTAPFRDVVVLVDLAGLTYEEAAGVLGCPRGTVMSRLFRARARLRRALVRLAREHGYVKEGQ